MLVMLVIYVLQKYFKMLSDNMGNNNTHCIQFRSIVFTHSTNDLIGKTHKIFQRLQLKFTLYQWSKQSEASTDIPSLTGSNHKYFKLANV